MKDWHIRNQEAIDAGNITRPTFALNRHARRSMRKILGNKKGRATNTTSSTTAPNADNHDAKEKFDVRK